MMSAEQAQYLATGAAVFAAVFTAASAGGVFWAASIAQDAAKRWRGVHDHAKADDCVSAAYDCLHTVERVIDLRLQGLNVFPSAYDDAWSSWRKFKLSHVVARRYYRRLDAKVPDEVANLLGKLKDWCKLERPQDPDPVSQTALWVAYEFQARVIKDALADKADALWKTLAPADAALIGSTRQPV